MCVASSFSYYFGVGLCFFMKMFSIMQQGTLGALITKKDRIYEENSGYLLLLECNF